VESLRETGRKAAESVWATGGPKRNGGASGAGDLGRHRAKRDRGYAIDDGSTIQTRISTAWSASRRIFTL